MGFVLTFAPLFCKLWRVNKIFNSGNFKVVTIKANVIFGMIFALALVDTVILVAWGQSDPLVYKRGVLNTFPDGDIRESVGLCLADSAETFVAIIAAFHISLLLWGCYLAYHGRNIQTKFHEGKQVVCVCACVLVLASLPHGAWH